MTAPGARAGAVVAESLRSLFIMYSSGTTGRPKGCQHSTGGYLAYVAGTSPEIVEDIRHHVQSEKVARGEEPRELSEEEVEEIKSFGHAE